MISKEQDKEVRHFLKLVEVKEQEIYNEFYDHIVTAYEERLQNEPSLSIDSYLKNDFQKAFGGVSGIKKIIKSRHAEANRYYRKQFRKIFLSFFRWPMILVVAALFLVIQKCFMLFEVKQVFIVIILISCALPMLLLLSGYLSFYLKCKRARLPYVSSVKNNNVLSQMIFITVFAQIPNWVKMIYGRDVELTGDFITVFILSVVITLMVIASMSYMSLMRKHFDFKFKLV